MSTVYLIRADAYFDREFLYGPPSGDYPDNSERFSFFSRAALELLRRERVDIVHGHDWQTALAIVFLKAQPARYPELAAAKTVFTVHNLGFQGIFGPPDWRLLDLDASFFTPQFLEFYGNINFLKGALVFADKLTTVSPSYAREIMTPSRVLASKACCASAPPISSAFSTASITINGIPGQIPTSRTTMARTVSN